MDQIAVAVVEKHEAVGSEIVRLAEKRDVESFEMFIRRIEIVHGDGEVPDAGILVVGHGLRRPRALARNDLDYVAVRPFDEKVSQIREIDVEAEMIDIPIREFLRIRRRDRRVLQALKHYEKIVPLAVLPPAFLRFETNVIPTRQIQYTP